MRTVKVFYENGDNETTRINGTEAEIKQYYEGKIFNIGHESDNLQKCIHIEFLD